jgi:hypothetical protein
MQDDSGQQETRDVILRFPLINFIKNYIHAF